MVLKEQLIVIGAQYISNYEGFCLREFVPHLCVFLESHPRSSIDNTTINYRTFHRNPCWQVVLSYSLYFRASGTGSLRNQDQYQKYLGPLIPFFLKLSETSDVKTVKNHRGIYAFE